MDRLLVSHSILSSNVKNWVQRALGNFKRNLKIIYSFTLAINKWYNQSTSLVVYQSINQPNSNWSISTRSCCPHVASCCSHLLQSLQCLAPGCDASKADRHCASRGVLSTVAASLPVSLHTLTKSFLDSHTYRVGQKTKLFCFVRIFAQFAIQWH